MKKISMGTWVFAFGPYAQEPIPLERILERLSEAEFDGVELSGFPPHATLDRYATRQSRAELLQTLEDLDLGISGYAADFLAVNPLVAENKQNYIDLFHRAVDLCVDIGSPAIRVDTVAAPGSIPDEDYRPAMERLADVWADAAEIAARGKVRLVWEFEPGFAFNKPSEILQLHRRVAHPNFQILFDTSHAYMTAVGGARHRGMREMLTGGVPALLKKLHGRIGAVHVCDSDGTLHHNETSTHCPFGEGYIDFALLAPALVDETAVEWWCIDLCFWPNAWDLVESSRDFVLELLNTKAVA